MHTYINTYAQYQENRLAWKPKQGCATLLRMTNSNTTLALLLLPHSDFHIWEQEVQV